MAAVERPLVLGFDPKAFDLFDAERELRGARNPQGVPGAWAPQPGTSRLAGNSITLDVVVGGPSW